MHNIEKSAFKRGVYVGYNRQGRRTVKKIANHPYYTAILTFPDDPKDGGMNFSRKSLKEISFELDQRGRVRKDPAKIYTRTASKIRMKRSKKLTPKERDFATWAARHPGWIAGSGKKKEEQKMVIRLARARIFQVRRPKGFTKGEYDYRFWRGE